MKPDIHPTYYSNAVITCACGAELHTGSTVKEMYIEICALCHPFYTGKKKIIDTTGRVDRFKKMAEKATVLKAATVPKKPRVKKIAETPSDVKEVKASKKPRAKKPAKTVETKKAVKTAKKPAAKAATKTTKKKTTKVAAKKK